MFPLLFKSIDIDPNRRGISVIECQGKTKIPLFARILNSLRIPFVVVHDHDIVQIDASWDQTKKKKAQDHNKQHNQWNADIAATVGDTKRVFVLQPDLEGICNLPRREDTKLQHAIQMFTGMDYKAVPSPLKNAVEGFLQFPDARRQSWLSSRSASL